MARGKDPIEAAHLRLRQRDQGREASVQLERFEDEGANPTLPGALQADLDAAIFPFDQAVFGDRGPGEVATEALERGAVVRRNMDIGVQLESWEPDKAYGARFCLVAEPVVFLGMMRWASRLGRWRAYGRWASRPPFALQQRRRPRLQPAR